MTHIIIKLISDRDKLYIKSLSTQPNTDEHIAICNSLHTISREVRKQIRESKTAFHKAELQRNKNDIRKTWETITNILNKSKIHKDFPKMFTINGQIIKDRENISSHFNNFFTNIGPNLAQIIDTEGKPSYKSYLQKQKIHTTFQFTPITEETTRKLINNFKPPKSAGLDNISGILLKFCVNTVSAPLTAIINQSLAQGIFPDTLKIAKVIPIYKKDDEQDLNNYRPISLLPTISKIFERIAHTQLFQYFTINNIFYNHQYGFREEHSTETALLEFIN